ncbi:Organic cation transporter 1 [Orchesella cincta]|uniref:Organic cation transporter 1 n=1 Tax=Orchesella cincta TaxID=48709 RepID=A0A1D2MPX4_ORCCI|nr:Organic cation transporter 1 [Orchesella cincta]
MNGVIYYAITLNASNLSGDQFLNFFILAMIEVPAGYFGSVLCDKIGRRWTQVIFFMVCVVFSIVAGIAADFTDIYAMKVISVIAAVVSKFAVTLTFLVVYLQATEIFPTPLRSTGSGFASTSASVIGIFTPFIVFSAKFLQGAPWFIIAIMSAIGVVSSAYLPETLNQSLPETLEEAENFGKDNKFWSFRPPPQKPSSQNGNRIKA